MDKKRYWLENLFDYERIAKLIRILPKTLNSDVDINFDYEGKKYTVTKNNKEIYLLCDDGRNLRLYANSCRSTGEFGGEFDITNVVVTYLLFNSRVVLYKGIENAKLTDLEDIETYQMADIDYCTFDNIECGFIQSFNYFTENSIDGFVFTKNGIQQRDYLISPDCEKVLSVNGKDLPPKEEIENFSVKKERAKYNKLINDSKLDSRTKEELIKNFNIDELSKQYEEVLELYNKKLPSLKDAVLFQRALVDGSIEDHLYSKEELDLFINELTKALKDKITEYDDFDILEETKKLVKSLSDMGLEALRKFLDGEDKK